MNKELRITIKNDKHWHELRRQNVGASDVACLFGASTFMSKFELWHQKRGNDMGFADNERMLLGRELEAGIASAACKKYEWKFISCAGQYYLHPTVDGMGCTPDGMIIESEGEGHVGAIEIKNVDYIQYRDKWKDDEPPLNYILQLQHQLAVTGLSYGYIVALIGGSELKAYRYERNEEAIAKIISAINEFWQSVAEEKEPLIESAGDLEVVKSIMKHEGEEQDLSADNELPDLCARFLAAKAERLVAEKKEKALQAEVIKKVGSYTFTLAAGFNISYKKVISERKAQPAKTTVSNRLTVKEV